MMKIVTDAGYKGYVGIEYEGNRMSEADKLVPRHSRELVPRHSRESGNPDS